MDCLIAISTALFFLAVQTAAQDCVVDNIQVQQNFQLEQVSFLFFFLHVFFFFFN